MKVGDVVYYTRILQKTNTYELIELVVRTADRGFYVGVDSKTKQAFPFSKQMIHNNVFTDRNTALSVLKEAEKGRKDEKKDDIEEFISDHLDGQMVITDFI